MAAAARTAGRRRRRGRRDDGTAAVARTTGRRWRRGRRNGGGGDDDGTAGRRRRRGRRDGGGGEDDGTAGRRRRRRGRRRELRDPGSSSPHEALKGALTRLPQFEHGALTSSTSQPSRGADGGPYEAAPVRERCAYEQHSHQALTSVLRQRHALWGGKACPPVQGWQLLEHS